MTSLQKESEWEKEFDKKFWIYFVQYYPEKENGLFGSIKSFIYQTIANREKEIAEEINSFPLSDSMFFDENNWKAGYKALEEFKNYLLKH
jgi:hypothetical protein